MQKENSITASDGQAALKVRGACRFLNVSRSSVMRLIKAGEIKPNRKLRHLLIAISELERWLNE